MAITMSHESLLHEQVQDRMIRAGDIQRHPTHQRPSPIRRFLQKFGDFDQAKLLNPIHVVADGKGKWAAIDGATRVEACLKSADFGPNTKLPCRVYGNGQPPSAAALDELFLLLNYDHVLVRADTAFKRAIGAGRPAAVFAESQIKRLGPKFSARIGVWAMVQNHGEQIVVKAVDEVLAIWGVKHHVPMEILSGIGFCLTRPKGASILKARRRHLRRISPEAWALKAKNAMLSTLGRRDALQTYVVKQLMGKRSSQAI